MADAHLPGYAPLTFTLIFLAALVLSTLLRLWLAARQVRHVASHRSTVPAAFAERISLASHHRAADYSAARVNLGVLDMLAQAAWLIVLTLLGGIQFLIAVGALLPESLDWMRPVLLVVMVSVASAIIDLPFSWWRQFRLEQRFGFNRMTPRLFITDMIKGALVMTLLGVPLAAAVLVLMDAAGPLWWLWAWCVWMGFNVVVLLVYPTWIAPLFNRFEPMPAGPIRERVERLLARTGFAAGGLFVMDGSRRSGHGNAYFTGFGRSRRIVFFDTLLTQLNADEVEAVLAHELGHFRLRHLVKRLVMMSLISLGALALLGWLSEQTWFYEGLGTSPDAVTRNACALVLFMLVMPVFGFLFAPVASWLSRRDEFAADAWAASITGAQPLVDALLKLYQDNAATLTPDALYSAVYDSHPPAPQRIGRLLAAAPSQPGPGSALSSPA
jgi:STE24 endopeptidase